MSLNDLDESWDVVVVGGGITGAGIFRQSVHQGYKTLLVEGRDFAWGTSSRSSKLVHGGLRYLKEGQLKLVRDSVKERQKLLCEAPGLVEPLPFLVPDFRGHSPPPWMLRAGLATYDLLAGQWQHRWLDRDQFSMAAPHIRREGLTGGGRFMDAQVDDARLVLRTLWEGAERGGHLLKDTIALLPRRENGVTWVSLVAGKQRKDVSAKVVFNAAGAWTDSFLERRPTRLRLLRGSHIVLPGYRLPTPCALSFTHPLDHRPNFVIPWEGATFCGTTDLDHSPGLDLEPTIAQEEVDYLLAGLDFAFPNLQLSEADVLATWAGVRPVISQGKDVAPSEETRDHGMWDENAVITVTGGKLTTFRLMAVEALEMARAYLPSASQREPFAFAQATQDSLPGLDRFQERRLKGRYGSRAQALVRVAEPAELRVVPGTETLWAELRWAAETERVTQLDDLLLRRTRLGLLMSAGGREHLPRIREICQAGLAWTDDRWELEQARYLETWRQAYALPSARG